MIPNILLTGASGFIGRNLLPLLLEEGFRVSCPTRAELNLADAGATRGFLEAGNFDVIIHAANPTGHNPVDRPECHVEDSLRVFMSLWHAADTYGKMFYFGSGAEYGKQRSLDMITEKEFGEVLPTDAYGLSRYVMSCLANQCDNIINLRLFGCYGPDDMPHKFIQNLLYQVKRQRELTLNHNILFDFLYVKDIFFILKHFILNPPQYKFYNLCNGNPLKLKVIAEEVCHQLGLKRYINITGKGSGLNYTASNRRLLEEIPTWKPTSMKSGITKILSSVQL